jgi:hypothetical protein
LDDSFGVKFLQSLISFGAYHVSQSMVH